MEKTKEAIISSTSSHTRCVRLVKGCYDTNDFYS